MLTRTPQQASLGGEGVPVGPERRAFFDFSVPAYFNEGFPVLKEFCSAGWTCTVMLEWGGRGALAAAAECRALGCTMIELPDSLLYQVETIPQTANEEIEAIASSVQPVEPKLRRRAFQWIAKYCPPAGRIIELLWSMLRLMDLRRFGERLVREARPDVVIFGPFNSYGRASNAVFAAAKRSGILMVCIPFAPLMGEPYQILERSESLRRGNIGPIVRADYDLFNRFCGLLFRSWTRAIGPVRLFHSDPAEVIAGRLAGLNFTDGWQKPSPYFDKVFVPSEHSLHCLRIADYPMERVVLSGVPRMDNIIRSLGSEAARREFYNAIHLPFESPFIVLNVEPLAEHKVSTWDEHWRLFRATMSAATSPGMPVVLSLHPLCLPENYAFAEREYGAIVRHSKSIYELTAFSAIVISSICSTLLTTQMLRKPTLVYDYNAMPDELARFFNLSEYVVCRDPETLARESGRLANIARHVHESSLELPIASNIIRQEVELTMRHSGRLPA